MNKCVPVTIGEIPSSFKESLSYYEAIAVLIDKVNELSDFVNTILTQQLSAYIDQRFNDMMIDAMYDAPTETLTLSLTEG
ncbi:MAG: hypothetical protein IKY26_04085 [Erysipelotrichaceae bacterium]|nr:hypothetical protein [Erysipelotrichaceae bacterium]